MSNHLNRERSPYLLQHANNPVEWYPWCEEAFSRARAEEKPIFLSIGYSTCHWCHVMAKESFENSEIADILNRHFISIKVDREERPDIDSVYMTFCQAFTGRGGWPMSIFMTAEQKPFFAGTYFPVDSRYGMIGFRELLLTVAQRWQEERELLLKTAGDIVAGAEQAADIMPVQEDLKERLPELAAERLAQSFDRENGGFGSAPKFPMPHNLLFLLLYSGIYQERAAREQVTITLEKMRRGGIFDQIGFGFSRYSTDSAFLVPHFEKMLYDNALLILAYGAAYKVTGESVFLDTAEKTAEYIFREMTGKEGEFYCAQDADSEGEEGGFYVWSYEEILHVLGEERGKPFCRQFNITPEGNFEGRNIPNLLNGGELSDQFQEEITLLYHYRKSRAALSLDHKVLTAWNALMIGALSVLYRITGREAYLAAAGKAQNFIERHLAKGKLLFVGCCGGEGAVKGFLDEYAYYTWALLTLYEVTLEKRYLERAIQVCEEAKRQFADETAGGYFLYGVENDSLITKPKEIYDGALPSGNSVMAFCLVRLWQLTDNELYKQEAERQLTFLSAGAQYAPEGHSVFLLALLYHRNPPQRITAVLSESDSREKLLCRLPLYADINILPEETREYKRMDGKTTYYICRDHVCLPPTTELY